MRAQHLTGAALLSLLLLGCEPSPPKTSPTATVTRVVPPSAPTRSIATFTNRELLDEIASICGADKFFDDSRESYCHALRSILEGRVERPRPASEPPAAVCEYSGTANAVIKGNVTFGSGERIYHVPGGEFYSSTVIDARFGESWFCTEAEAARAGWRRSLR